MGWSPFLLSVWYCQCAKPSAVTAAWCSPEDNLRNVWQKLNLKHVWWDFQLFLCSEQLEFLSPSPMKNTCMLHPINSGLLCSPLFSTADVTLRWCKSEIMVCNSNTREGCVWVCFLIKCVFKTFESVKILNDVLAAEL